MSSPSLVREAVKAAGWSVLDVTNLAGMVCGHAGTVIKQSGEERASMVNATLKRLGS